MQSSQHASALRTPVIPPLACFALNFDFA
eukprot:COSAG06_NODE_15866_length_1039_cov_0.887234_2_plen_28_part_01